MEKYVDNEKEVKGLTPRVANGPQFAIQGSPFNFWEMVPFSSSRT